MQSLQISESPIRKLAYMAAIEENHRDPLGGAGLGVVAVLVPSGNPLALLHLVRLIRGLQVVGLCPEVKTNKLL